MNEIIGKFLTVIFIVVISGLIGAAIAAWLWGLIVVPVFGAPVLGYWQMYGIIILIKLLFPMNISSSN